jgi:hypothetical protein
MGVVCCFFSVDNELNPLTNGCCVDFLLLVYSSCFASVLL